MRDPGALKVLQQAPIAFFEDGQLSQKIFQTLFNVLGIRPGIDRECLREVIGEADVVDDETPLLTQRNAIDAGDGLQQVVFEKALVDIHDLLNWGVEPRKEHVANDQERDARELRIGIFKVKGLQKFSTALMRRASLRASVITASSLVGSAETTTAVFRNETRRIKFGSG